MQGWCGSSSSTQMRTSRNFETVDDRGFVYFTSFNLSDCKVTWDRDLMRLEVAISTDVARATEAP